MVSSILLIVFFLLVRRPSYVVQGLNEIHVRPVKREPLARPPFITESPMQLLLDVFVENASRQRVYQLNRMRRRCPELLDPSIRCCRLADLIQITTLEQINIAVIVGVGSRLFHGPIISGGCSFVSPR